MKALTTRYENHNISEGGRTAPGDTAPTPAPLRAASRVRSAYHALRNPPNQMPAHTVARGNEFVRETNKRGTRGWRRNDARWHRTNPQHRSALHRGCAPLTTRYEPHKIICVHEP
ncbi:Putative uncharacterized protein [Halomonas sp. R57-5]|nr:Putative uncharacterized protein [Halomonas sp. R57-5]